MARKIAQRHQNKPEAPVKLKIKKDDTVKVIAGSDKGKTGRVLDVDRVTRQGAGGRRGDGEAPHAAESVEADQGRHRGAGKHDRDLERDDPDLGRRGDAGRLSRRRHGSVVAAGALSRKKGGEILDKKA